MHYSHSIATGPSKQQQNRTYSNLHINGIRKFLIHLKPQHFRYTTHAVRYKIRSWIADVARLVNLDAE